MTKKSTLDHMYEAADRGWPVFPLAPGTKVPPRGTDGPKSATTDTDQIHQWAKQYPNMNYGIATGPAGLVVIDIDVPKVRDDTETRPELFGIEAWTMLVTNAGLNREPRTYEVWTPSGGEHLYWLANPALPIKTGTSKLAPGIDVRATNGTIVGAGSKTPKGIYELHNGTDPKSIPSWLRTALGRAGMAVSDVERAAKPSTKSFPVNSPDRYASAAFDGEIATLRGTPIGAGQRNAALNHAAFKLRKFITAVGDEAPKLQVDEVANALYSVAVNELGMKDSEAEATIHSGMGV